MNTFQYNSSAVNYYTTQDLGSIGDAPSSTVDSGTVSSASSSTVTYGDVVFTETVYPYGSIKFSSNTTESASVKFITAGTIKLDTAYVVKYRSAWVGSGSLFEIASGKERIIAPWIGSSGPLRITGSSTSLCTYEYNDSAVVEYSSDDYGNVSSTITSSINHGEISILASGEENLGAIFISNTVRPYGNFNLIGESSIIYKPSFAWRGSGSLFGISNTAESVLFNYQDNISLLKFYNVETNSLTKPYIGSGGLFNIGDRIERATYSYNQSSIKLYNPEQDYGSIAASGTTTDLGFVNQSVSNGEINYGLINISDIDYPLNVLFNISGESTNSYKPSFTWKGSGSLFAISNTAESATFSYARTVLFNLSGGERDAFSRPYIGSGGLFNIGDRTERATYSYNQSSIKLYNLEQDYGLITASGTTIDLGYVSNPTSDGEVDYGLINVSDIDYPLNVLFNISGQALSEYRPVFTQIGSGSLKFHHEPKATDTRFIPWWRGRGGASIFNSIIPDAFSRPYIGSGNLFSFGDKVESATYDYNTSSTEFFTSEDYGVITSSGIVVDYGHVSESNVGITDYSSIINLDVDYPLNLLYRLTGEGVGQFIRGPYSGKGNIFISGLAIEKQTDDWTGTGFAYVSGTAIEKNTESYVGSGSLFHIGDRIEKATYSYNSSSVYGYDEYNYGFITASGNTIDYGYVTELSSGGEVDLGNIIDLDVNYPYGLFSIFGASDNRWIQVFTKVGSGSLFEFNGATEAFSAQTPESTALYIIQGNSEDSRSKIFIGQGSLFSIGDKVERASYSYNQSSVVSYESEIDYGTITTSGTTIDLGYVSEVVTEGEINYGSITLLDYDYPVNVLFKITGESFTELKPSFNYKGRGTINIASDLTFVRFRPHWRSVGGGEIYGNSLESDTKTFVGSGSLFAFSGATEAFSANTPENTILFNISGSSTQSFQKAAEFESGSLFGFSGAVESATFNPPETTTLFNIFGTSLQKNTESYVGKGSLFNIGDRVERRTYDYNLSSIKVYNDPEYYGFINELFTKSEDYGFVTSIADSGEVDYGYVFETGFDYPLNTLFKISGSSTDIFRPAFVETGFGSINISGQETSAYSPSLKSYGEITVSGAADQKNTESYVGTGSLFGFNGLAESAGVSEEFTTLLRISGQSKEVFVNTVIIESGSLFGFNGAAESITSTSPESIALFNIHGSAIQKHTESYVGSGSLFHVGDRVEKATYSYNTSSVFNYDDYDYGYITAAGTNIDLGYVNSVASDGEVDYGNVIDLDTAYPFGLFTINGQSSVKWIQVFTKIGSGSLFGLSGAVESVSSTSFESIVLFNISGSSTEKNTESYVGSGSLFAFSGATEAFSANTPENTILFNVSGSSTQSFQKTAGFESGSLFAFSGATEAFSANTPENTFLYSFAGFAQESKSKYFAGSGSLFHVGDRVERATYSYNTSSTIDPQSITNYGSIAEVGSNIDYGYISSIVDSGEIDYGNITAIPGTEVPFGLFKISGIANTPFERSYSGSGSFYAITGTTEAFSAQTPENTFLYTFSGSAKTPRTRPFIASGDSLTITGYIVEKHTESYQGFAQFKFEERFPAASVANTESYVGSGNITLSTGRFPEYLNYRPTPRYVNSIYGNIGGELTISGNATTKPITVFTKIGSGSQFISGSKVERQTDSWKGTGNIDLQGNADADRTRSYVGTGFFSILKGAAESFSAQTPENTFLYRITGSATEKNTERFIGSGSLSSIGTATVTKLVSAATRTVLLDVYGSAVPVITLSHYGSGSLFAYRESTSSVTFNPVENTILYQISGSASLRRSDKYDALGAINLTGSLIEKNTESYNGSGNLYNIGSSSASTTFNPVENIALFNVHGSAIEKHTERYIGSGDLFSFGKSDSRVTFNPVEEITTFVISGNAGINKSRAFNGSGTLFQFNGSSESISYSAVQSTILYRISGAATVKHVERYVGAGTQFISGSATEKHTETFNGTGSIFAFGSKIEVKAVSETGIGSINIFGYISEVYTKAPYVGSGSLFAFKGATESKVSNPLEETVLFRFTGSATEKHTESYEGKVSAHISGSAIEKHTEKYAGAGKVSITNSAAVAFIAQTPEETILYRISGAAVARFIPRYTGSGSQTISGTIVERQTDSYRGSGSLFGIGNTSYNILVTAETDTSTSLFKLFGSSPQKYSRISVTNKFNVEISGASTDIVILFSPARIFGTII